MMAADMTFVCNKPECTLAQTGRCVLDHDPESCPDRLESLKNIDTLVSQALNDLESTGLNELTGFRSSYTLNVAQTQN